MGKLQWRKGMLLKSQTTNSVCRGRCILCILEGPQGILWRWGTKEPSFFKQPDIGVQMGPELVHWLSVAALRVPRTCEATPYSSFSAQPSPTNHRSAPTHCLDIALSESSAGVRN